MILSSTQKEDGVVRLVCATVALGMGINLVVIRYGAPSSTEDYFENVERQVDQVTKPSLLYTGSLLMHLLGRTH